MRITADVNILVSSTFWSGDSDKVLRMIENDEAELVLSAEILDDFRKVLDYPEIKDKIRGKGLEMNRTVEKIESISTIVRPETRLDVVKEDPDDNKILECALAGKVDYVISNDKHLLKVKEYSGIRIIKPEELLIILKEKRTGSKR
ncbi:MAG: putative toxin-antitoxin system toxin component, PIN family [archaeon]